MKYVAIMERIKKKYLIIKIEYKNLPILQLPLNFVNRIKLNVFAFNLIITQLWEIILYWLF